MIVRKQHKRFINSISHVGASLFFYFQTFYQYKLHIVIIYIVTLNCVFLAHFNRVVLIIFVIITMQIVRIVDFKTTQFRVNHYRLYIIL